MTVSAPPNSSTSRALRKQSSLLQNVPGLEGLALRLDAKAATLCPLQALTRWDGNVSGRASFFSKSDKLLGKRRRLAAGRRSPRAVMPLNLEAYPLRSA